MTISSAAAPDLDAICRAHVGREVVAAERIGSGRNSRVFRAGLSGTGAPSHVVVKFYRRDRGDPRDRLATEFGALQFLWQNDVRAIPYPIAADRDRYCAIYEYIAGDVPDGRAVTAGEVDASVRFLSTLKALRTRPGSGELPAASEACFSPRALAAHVEQRLDRLRRRDAGSTAEERRLNEWLDGAFEPLMRDALAWCRARAVQARISFDDELVWGSRTLSPSDFGFHNAIRRPDATLAFVDFEYFGWDDPAKTVCDFVLHPGMALADESKRRFAAGVLSAFADDAALADRAQIVYPMFGLKWCLILLNDFLPERAAALDAGDGQARHIREAQLARADALARRLRGEYRDNPILAHR